jgi:hypothetical protein
MCRNFFTSKIAEEVKKFWRIGEPTVKRGDKSKPSKIE